MPDASGYSVYYDQAGKYALLATTTDASFSDGGLTSGQTYCYAVAAYRLCDDGMTIGSDPGETVCITIPSKRGGGGKPRK